MNAAHQQDAGKKDGEELKRVVCEKAGRLPLGRFVLNILFCFWLNIAKIRLRKEDVLKAHVYPQLIAHAVNFQHSRVNLSF